MLSVVKRCSRVVMSRGSRQEEQMKLGWEMQAGRRLRGLVGSGPGKAVQFEVKRVR